MKDGVRTSVKNGVKNKLKKGVMNGMKDKGRLTDMQVRDCCGYEVYDVEFTRLVCHV